MLKITLIAVGSIKEKHWREAQTEYLTRLRPMARIEVTETPASPITASFTAEQSKRTESTHIIKKVPKGAMVIAMDENGREMTSRQFAGYLDGLDQATQPVCFVIGGTAGLDESVLKMTDQKIALSKMTFPHEMARVFLLEQIYRGLTILGGKKYHY